MERPLAGIAVKTRRGRFDVRREMPHKPGNSNRVPERAGDLWGIMTGKKKAADALRDGSRETG
jgi:hypothetical protein